MKLSTTYSTRAGDTFAGVSRKVFGVESYSSVIASANPGVFDPLPAAIQLIIPQVADAPANIPQNSPAGGIDEVSLTILGKRFRFWDGVTVKNSIDSVDTLELTAPFDALNAEFIAFFRPFEYQPVTASIGGELVFTGTLITVKPTASAKGVAVAAGAYSLPGVLVDCCAPASMFADNGEQGDSLEFENADLRSIAKNLLTPFGLTAVFIAPPGKAFEVLSMQAGEEVMPFLAKLAKQRNLVITSNAKGQVVFWQSNPGGDPVARFVEGVAGPMSTIDADFKTQSYFSHLTGISRTEVGSDGGQYTAKNSRLPGVLRPFTFEATEAEGESIVTATKAKLGRMFGDAIAYSVELDTWRDSRGKLWAPNTTVIVEAPSVMIYKPYELLIRDVTFKRDSNGAGATLTLVLPASYSGEIPGAMPWDL